MRLDLPTLERPANATSGRSASGRNCKPGALFTNSQGRANSTSPAASCSPVNSAGHIGPLSGRLSPHVQPHHPAGALRALLAPQDLARGIDLGGDGVIGAVEAAVARL